MENNRFKSLPDRIWRNFCYGQVILNVIPLNVEALRYIHGPLPIWLCHIYSLIRNDTIFIMTFILDQGFIVKYLYGSLWVTAGSIDDDFFDFFLKILNSVFFIYYGLLGNPLECRHNLAECLILFYFLLYV